MLYLICCALLFVPSLRPSPAPAQDAPLQMMTYQLVLLKKGPTPPPANPTEQKKMQDEHLAGLAELNRKQVNMVYGPIFADADIRGIAVLAVANAEEAKARLANDPFVK